MKACFRSFGSPAMQRSWKTHGMHDRLCVYNDDLQKLDANTVQAPDMINTESAARCMAGMPRISDPAAAMPWRLIGSSPARTRAFDKMVHVQSTYYSFNS